MTRVAPFLSAIVLGTGALFAIGSGACGTPVTVITADNFLKSYDDAFCAYLVKCGELPDTASCKTAHGPDALMAQAVSSVVFGTLEFDSTAGQKCLDAVKAAGCETKIGGPLQKDILTACSAAFTKKGASGAACFIGIECASGNCDAKQTCGSDCCVGKCVDMPTTVADGMVCIDPMTAVVSPCVAGDYCSAATKMCAKQAMPNAACTEADSCVDGYVCDTNAKICFKPAPSGSQCNPSIPAGACLAIDEYCDANSMKCTKLPRAGSPCVMDNIHNNACARDASCVMGTCTLLPQTDDMCPGMVCLGDLKCDKTTMKCGPLPAAHACVED